MRTFTIAELTENARKVLSEAYLRGDLDEKTRLRKIPRDTEKTKMLAQLVSERLRKNPMRRNPEGTLFIPGVSG